MRSRNLCNFRVEARAVPLHLSLGDAGISAERLHLGLDFAGRDPVDVGLHDDREHSLIDPAPPLQQGGEERSLPQLRDPQIEIPAVVVNVRGLVPLR